MSAYLDSRGLAYLWTKLKEKLDGKADVGHTHTAAEIGAEASGEAAAVQANLTAHTGNKSNPHGVTAAQAGALPLSGGTLTGVLKVPAGTDYTTYKVRNVAAGTTDMTAGTTALANGAVYLVYV